MAIEPERPIEKLLRNCAQKRRSQLGADFEPHPATRNWLQSQVARQHRPPGVATPRPAGWLPRFWPRLAWGTALAATLSLAIWLAVPSTKPPSARPVPLLAKSEVPTKPEPPSPAASPENARAALANRAKDESLAATPRDADPRDTAPAASPALALNYAAPPPTVPATPPASGPLPLSAAPEPSPLAPGAGPVVNAPALAGTTAGSNPASAAESGLAQVVVARSASEPADRFRMNFADNGPPATSSALDQATAKTWARTGSALPTRSTRGFTPPTVAVRRQGIPRRQFARVPPPASALADPTPRAGQQSAVLASFEIEQVGRELRVIDADGSVYSGRLRAETMDKAPGTGPSPVTANRTLKASDSETSAVISRPEPTEYRFEVTGTNRTTRQRVVFSGHLATALPAPSDSPRGAVRLSGGTGTRMPLPAATNGVLRLDGPISGTATIGQDPPLPINAVPVLPH